MLRFDLRPLLGHVRCPTLISVGSLDPITPPWAAEEMATRLHDGIGSVDVIDGAGHFPWRDSPERYWSSIEGFISSIA
ncbi:MAG TPA: alpha/beta hydrolase [Acidimicrobiia bacterium]|nr:alpha/beta hydrolase [Acidimicrobiia bacterium]